ncbi:MAG: Arm DNA-binding domain-containing protein [Acidobacteria bacterium]|nr:Arm DNA-binding domain-containing protein [Acidobacteriota bacterium]
MRTHDGEQTAKNHASRPPSRQGPVGRPRPFRPARQPLRRVGLYLVVQPTGTRNWIQRIVIRGRKREVGLGSTALVPLAEARERALSNRNLAREGGGLLAEKRRAEAMPTFADAAARVVERKRAGGGVPSTPGPG